jgi:hypothetical protein
MRFRRLALRFAVPVDRQRQARQQVECAVADLRVRRQLQDVTVERLHTVGLFAGEIDDEACCFHGSFFCCKITSVAVAVAMSWPSSVVSRPSTWMKRRD